MKIRSGFLLLIGILLLQVSCREGELAQQSVPSPILITATSLTNYDDTTVSVLVTGQVQSSAIVDIDEIQFFDNTSCSGVILGSSLIREFKENGTIIDIPIGSKNIFLSVSTRQSSDCIFLKEYSYGELKPDSPRFSSISPESPSRETNSPGLFGRAYPESGDIEFYDDDTCSNVLASGSAEQFATQGIQVPLAENSTTQIHARVKDAFDNYSECTSMTEFRHSNQVSAAPTFISLSETSPNNFVLDPIVRGSAVVGSSYIALYSDSGCTSMMVDGDPVDFETTGFQINVTGNSTTNIYAQAIDEFGNPSVCALLTSYVHDNIPPSDPVYSAANPPSPTRITTLPRISGNSSTDTEDVLLFDSNLCLNQIGTGRKSDFEGAGVTASVPANSTTSIFAKAFDGAGNGSACIAMTDYTHNTIAPNAPLFLETIPESPTNVTTTPLIRGSGAPRTVQLNFYKDESCTMDIGDGSITDFEGPGIMINADANADTAVYVTVSDLEGNVSPCNFLASYSHSNSSAVAPGFFTTFPVSPTNASNNPFVVGTADNSLATVTLYDSNTCSNSLGSGTRGQYISTGIGISVPVNSTIDIYAIGTDVFGNDSVCTFITQFIHNTVVPNNPSFSASVPVSPNNSSTTPLIQGDVLNNPASQLLPSRVAFFDSFSCVSKLGEGTPAEYNSTGIQINVAQNAETTLYARAYDDAGNQSDCTFLTNYTHNNLVPGAPIYLSANPASPSYSRLTRISGTYSPSSDFMNKVNVGIYDDSSCTNELSSGAPALFEGAGIEIEVADNAISGLYADTLNEVGTRSACTFLSNFRHYDLGPSNSQVISNLDGSVTFNWFPDTTSSPLPRYSVERSTSATGPFSVIASDLISNNYRDYSVSDGEDYYYRVFAGNITGRSQYSSVANVTISAPAPVQASSLVAYPDNASVNLSWSGFPQNMSYKIFRSTEYGGPFTDLGVDQTNTTFFDTGLVNGQDYYYYVVAKNPAGQSIQSNVSSVTPRATASTPTNLVMTVNSSMEACGGARGIQLSWTAPEYYNNFRLMRGNTKSANNPLATIGATQTNRCGYGNNDLEYFRVRSIWGVNESSGSNTVGFYSTNAPNFNIYPGNGEILLSWTDPALHADLSGFTLEFDLYKSNNHDGPYNLLASGLTVNSYTDPTTNGNGAYYYVQAYVIDGDTDKIYVGYPSAILSGTAATDPNAPSNLSIRRIESDGRVELNWTGPDYYNGFNVYRATSPGGPYTLLSYETNSLVLNVPVLEDRNYFKVTTVWGSYESADSNVVDIRDANITGFNASANTTQVNLSWGNVALVQDYAIWRATNINGPYTEIDTTGLTSYSDTSAVSGVGYYYKVQARFADLTRGQLSGPQSAMLTDTSIPSNVSLKVNGTSNMRADWPHVSGATIYTIETATNVGGPYIVKGTTALNTRNISGLLPQTEYFVRVTATVGMNDFTSIPVSAYTFSQPNAPTGTVGDGQIEINWTPLAGAIDYDLYRSTDGINFTPLATDYPSTNYTDLTVVNGSIYFYKFIVDYGSATAESPSSTGYTPGRTPSTPTDLVAENNNTGTEVELSWTAVPSATSYNIYQATSSGAYGAPVRSSTGSHGIRVTGLTTDTTYYFSVKALIGSTESLYSNEVVVVPQLEPVKPDAQYFDGSTVQVDWVAIPGATTYSVYRSIDGFVFDELATGIGTNTYQDSSVDPNFTYYYKYKGFSGSGAEMSLSARSDGVNLSTSPLTPAGFFAYATSNTEINLTWIQTPSIQGYEVFRSTTQGGPYSLIASPLSTETSYLDSGLTPGNRYFYVIRSLSLSGVPSADSPEQAIDLNGGPANLVASNGVSGIDLAWDVLAGAISYNVRRSDLTGGPYGVITNVGTNSYTDSDIEANGNYFYVVEAVFADSSRSQFSNEDSVIRSGFIDLQVPIELTDIKMASSSLGAVSFERSQTSIDTDAYDGVTSYELEVIATNFDVSARNVNLLNESDVVVGSVSIPSGVGTPTRYRSTFTPTSGYEIYRVQIEQTNNDSELNVYAAKAFVNQTDATKTRLYFPLTSSEDSPNNQDASVSIHSTSSEAFEDFANAGRYLKDTTKLSKIVDFNAWQFEALVGTQGTSSGIVALENTISGQLVERTETRFYSNSIELASIPFDEGVGQFSSANNGDLYKPVLRCELECSGGSVRLYKAGLWVRLENLSKAQIIHRLNPYRSFVSSSEDFTEERALIDLSQYSNPTTYFRAVVEDDPSSDATISLIHHSDDTGVVGLSEVAGSPLVFNNDGVSIQDSGALTINSGDRFMTRVTPGSGFINFISSMIVIEVE